MPGTFTEADIRKALDGTFTRVATYRAPKTQRNPDRQFVKLPKKMRGKAWSEAENAIILEMLAERCTQMAIAAKLGRCFSAVNKRVKELRKAGRIG